MTTRSGNRRIIKTTVGRKLIVHWKDVTQQWVPLKLLKKSDPLEVVESSKARNIEDETVL